MCHFLVRLDPTISIDTAGPFRLTEGGEISAEDSILPDWVAGDLSLTLKTIADRRAVDSRVDVTLPYLARNIWVIDDEVCGNEIDDDLIGFVDDWVGGICTESPCRGWDLLTR